MMSPASLSKVINDPIYGFVRINHPIVLDLINHSFFQRLRRITQMGFSSFVYPGAVHTRFHHSLGAYHLMQRAINELRQKSHTITREEEKAALIAILLHDVGHGPFSHALEKQLLPLHHEEISEQMMCILNHEMGGQLDLAQAIFKGTYHKQFLCQLIRSQVDVDRLDYLSRDSFYTGVVEGNIGYDRILSMLDVDNDHLTVEGKGMNSIEHFLLSRHFMYQQVYYHKIAVATEMMLAKALKRARYLLENEAQQMQAFANLPIARLWKKNRLHQTTQDDIFLFAKIDDTDIWSMLKMGESHEDAIFSTLCKAILHRQVFHVVQQDHPIDPQFIQQQKIKTREKYPFLRDGEEDYLVFAHDISIVVYKTNQTPILIQQKNKTTSSIDKVANSFFEGKSKNAFSKYYFCYI